MRLFFARSFLLLLMASFTALLINLISDDVEHWLGQKFGGDVNYVLTILFVIGTMFTLFLTDWKELFGKDHAQKTPEPETPVTAPAPNSSPFSASSAPSSETVSTASYTTLMDLLRNARTQALLKAMLQEPALERLANNLFPRYNLIKQKEEAGTLNFSEVQEQINRIHEVILNRLESYRPASIDVAQHESTATKTTQFACLIEGANDRLLETRQNIVGRAELLQDVIQNRLDKNGHHGLVITGSGGIGKTDFCKLIIKEYLRIHPDVKAYWIDAEQIPNAETLVAALAECIGLDASTAAPVVLAALKTSGGFFYLDNLETPLENDSAKVTHLLKQLSALNNTTWLASSRMKVPHWHEVELLELDIQDALPLFIRQWELSSGMLLSEAQPGLKDFVEKDLGCHPLSIILTASNGSYFQSIEELMEAWKNGHSLVSQRVGGDAQNRLDNLDYSIGLSFQSLRHFPGAIRLWALCRFFPNGLSEADTQYFMEQAVFTIADRAAILQRSILRNKNGRLTMLPPLARFIEGKLADQKSDLEKNLFDTGLAYAMGAVPEDLKPTPQWLNRLPFVFQFLMYFSDKANRYPEVLRLAKAMDNYFNREVFLAKNILQTFLSKPFPSGSEYQNMKAQLTLNLGSLEFRLGDNEKARSHYEAAKSLYEKTGDDQGKANCLRNLGSLEFRLGNSSSGSQFFEDSFVLYERIGNVRDLIHSLIDYSNCLKEKEQLEAACQQLKKAEEYAAQKHFPELSIVIQDLKQEWGCG